jgi:hypothetical protein
MINWEKIQGQAMKKVPVGHTIAQTYDFAFRKYLTLLGIVWFPVVIMGLLGLFAFLPLMKNYFGMMQVMMTQHGGPPVLPTGFGHMIGAIFIADFAILYLYLAVRVGIAKELLGLRTGPRFIYTAFGTAELRALGGYVLAFLIAYAAIIVVAVVATILAIIVGVASGVHPQGYAAVGGIVILLIFAAELVFLYALIRLTFFIVPVAVAEKELGIFESWRMTRGNFWRIFAVLLAIWVPLFIVEFIAFAILMGGQMAAIFSQAMNGNHPPDMQAIMNVYLGALPWFFIGGFVFMPVIYGLIGAPSVFAYLSLKEAPQELAA